MSLPVETWGEVFDFTRPSDLLSLSGTSRALYSLISRKSLWIRILHRVCYEKGLFMPSYDVEDMDIGQLRRAALGPDRWRRLVESNRQPLPSLATRKALKPLSTVDIAARGEGLQHYLAPGGRFLVTFHMPDLELWDLSDPWGPTLKIPVLISHTLVRGGALPARLGRACIVGNSIRLALITSGVNVYEIDLSSNDTPHFKLLGTLLQERVAYVLIDDDHVIVFPPSGPGQGREDLCLTIWNFKTARYTPWTIKEMHKDPVSTILAGELLVFFFDDSVKIARVPQTPHLCPDPTVWRADEHQQHTVDILTEFSTVAFTFQRLHNPRRHDIQLAIPVAWKYEPGIPLLFDAFFHEIGHRHGIPTGTASRYRLDIVTKNQGLDVPLGDFHLKLKLLETFSLMGPAEYHPQGHQGRTASDLESVARLTTSNTVVNRLETPSGDISRPVTTLNCMVYSVIPRTSPETREGLDQDEGFIDACRRTSATVGFTSLLEIPQGNDRWSLCTASGRLVCDSPSARRYLISKYLR